MERMPVESYQSIEYEYDYCIHAQFHIHCGLILPPAAHEVLAAVVIDALGNAAHLYPLQMYNSLCSRGTAVSPDRGVGVRWC